MKKDIKIFIVSDDAQTSNNYKNTVSDLGYNHIFTLSDAKSCINSLLLNPEVIFVDYGIESNSGIELLKKIKTINPLSHVIMVSKIEDMNDSVESLAYGAYDLILKGDMDKEHVGIVLENISHILAHKVKRSNSILQRVASVFWSL